MRIKDKIFCFIKNRLTISLLSLCLSLLIANFDHVSGCKLFGANGDVTRDSVTIIAKNRDLYSSQAQKIWLSPREAHSTGDTIHFRHISVPQCSLTYKFIASNSIVEDQTAGYGVNEYGLAIISHDMDSWDDDSLGAEYFHDQDYVALVLARCKKVSEAIDLFRDLILPYGINAETYIIADPDSSWLMETTGFNYVAKPVVDDVVSSQGQQFTIRTEWSDVGNRYNPDILANAHAHGCDTTALDFAQCFGNRAPGSCDPYLLALKDRGNITVEDIRALVSDRAIDGTVSACVIPVRPDNDAGHFSFMWDSRANPKYDNVFLPYWIAISDTALPAHYTSWPAEDSLCAWDIFTEIVEDSTLRSVAEPIWQALQAELYVEFDTVEANMQTYLDSNDLPGLQEYVSKYVYGELDSAYNLAREIIDNAGVPKQIADLTIALSIENLVLRWSQVTADVFGHPLAVDQYLIYRDTMAYFDPGSEPFDSTVTLFYTDDTGVAGDTETNYYYAVTAVSSGKESAMSGLVGEFDREVITGE